MRDRPLSPRSLLLACAVALLACQGATDGTACLAECQIDDGTRVGAGPGDPSGAGGEGAACVPDACSPSGAGVTWNCETRFMYGTNWAWRSFAGDFGGVASWGLAGVDANPAPFSAGLAQMKAAGASVIRWWMFPRLLTDTIRWGADGAPDGIAPALAADVQRALALAEEHDVYIMLTPFSFDNFRPTGWENGVYSRSLAPMVVDGALRRKVMDNLLGPIADAVARSPHRKRMIAWDVINEPEWAMTGPSVTGDPAFPAQPGLDLVTHGQMETFLADAVDVLRARSGALVSVGGAAIKWAKAWSRIGLDFYQFHYYDWVYEFFPYTSATLASMGVTDKPVVMGEFPSDGVSAIGSKGLPARSAPELTADLAAHGYAGALSWAYNDPSFSWDPGAVKAYADARGCEVRY
ncbi:MAG TPA: hypothetical protein VFL83_02165 [Anaeromyxobacter sp.]|nr:hypothetical protein [Anaeromyxobacter sp.]